MYVRTFYVHTEVFGGKRVLLKVGVHAGNAVWLPGVSTPAPWTNQSPAHGVYVSVLGFVCIFLNSVI
jgi:hypothetical protein